MISVFVIKDIRRLKQAMVVKVSGLKLFSFCQYFLSFFSLFEKSKPNISTTIFKFHLKQEREQKQLHQNFHYSSITDFTRFVVILDIDECTRETTACSHNCTNTDGSFNCTCNIGHFLLEDRVTCRGKYIKS